MKQLFMWAFELTRVVAIFLLLAIFIGEQASLAYALVVIVGNQIWIKNKLERIETEGTI